MASTLTYQEVRELALKLELALHDVLPNLGTYDKSYHRKWVSNRPDKRNTACLSFIETICDEVEDWAVKS